MTRPPVPRPWSILLDAEALSAFASAQRSMQVWAELARRTDSTLHTATVTLAETTDGGARDASVRRAIKAVRLHELTAGIGYRAGELRARAASRRKPRDLTVDAVVAATALTLTAPAIVLTADAGDLALLLDGTGVRVESL